MSQREAWHLLQWKNVDKNMSFCPSSAMSHGGHFGRQMRGMYKQDDDHSCQPTPSFLGRILVIYRSAGQDNGWARTAPEMFIEIWVIIVARTEIALLWPALSSAQPGLSHGIKLVEFWVFSKLSCSLQSQAIIFGLNEHHEIWCH